jgi:hypothetical protein
MAPPLPPSAHPQNAMRQFRVAMLFNLFDAFFTNGTAGCRPKRFKFAESVVLNPTAATNRSLPSVSCELIAITVAVKIRNVLCCRLGGEQHKNNEQRSQASTHFHGIPGRIAMASVGPLHGERPGLVAVHSREAKHGSIITRLGPLRS